MIIPILKAFLNKNVHIPHIACLKHHSWVKSRMSRFTRPIEKSVVPPAVGHAYKSSLLLEIKK